MTVLYFDCFSGIAGNMVVASLLDLGASREKLVQGLLSIPFVEGKIDLIIEERMVDGIRGIYFNTREDDHDHSHEHDHDHDHSHEHTHTHCHEDQGQSDSCDKSHSAFHHSHHQSNEKSEPHSHAPHRGFKDIAALVAQAEISDGARRIALACFEQLAVAEATIHGKSIDDVHFHEVGARDSIADIVGAAICFDDLQVEKVYVSPVHLGSGMVKCAHGIMPVPAPATALLLKGLPVVFDYHIKFELTTPTGAAILKGVNACPLSSDMALTFAGVGHGHGSLKTGQANFLRTFLSGAESQKKNTDSIVLIETNIDNASGEIIGHAADELLRLGALDVCLIPVVMKKGRPGHIIQIQTTPEMAVEIEKAIFRLLPTLGVRRRFMDRTTLPRQKISILTDHGEMAGKRVYEHDGGSVEKIEFDEIARVAREQGTTPQKLLTKLQHAKKLNR